MLWYKAWRESRARFLIAAGAVTVFSIGSIIQARASFPPPEYPMLPYTAFVWSTFFSPGRAAAFTFVALVFSLGGLRRERATGTAAFTLALPLSRGQLVRARIVVGLLELAAIAAVPVIVVSFVSPVIAHKAYPFSQSIRYGTLFMSWGCVWFAIGFVWSVVFSAELTAAVASVLSPLVYMVVYANVSRGGQRFFAANPFAMMSGGLDRSFRAPAFLSDPLPWREMLVLAIVTAVLLFGSWRATVRQDF